MSNPQNLNTSKFKIEKIIYDVDGFSIAYGLWEDKTKLLAVRWNGEKNEIGFPQTFGKPQWLIISADLTVIFLKALLDTDEQTEKKPIIRILQNLL